MQEEEPPVGPELLSCKLAGGHPVRHRLPATFVFPSFQHSTAVSPRNETEQIRTIFAESAANFLQSIGQSADFAIILQVYALSQILIRQARSHFSDCTTGFPNVRPKSCPESHEARKPPPALSLVTVAKCALILHATNCTTNRAGQCTGRIGFNRYERSGALCPCWVILLR